MTALRRAKEAAEAEVARLMNAAPQAAQHAAEAVRDAQARATAAEAAKSRAERELADLMADLSAAHDAKDAEVADLRRERDAAVARAERAEAQAARPPTAPMTLLTQPPSVGVEPLMRFAMPFTLYNGLRLAPLGAMQAAERSMIEALWADGGVGGAPNRFAISRIEVLDAARQRSSFINKVEDFSFRRAPQGGPFNVAFQDSPAAGAVHDPNGEKRAVLTNLKRRFVDLPGIERANILPVFHGCTHAAADGICGTGFAAISTLDAGFFGRGIYSSTFAQYACEYATGAINGTPNPTNGDGEHVVLLAWAVPGLTYPITRGHAGNDCDYDAGFGFSQFYSPTGERAKALRAPFDSHYVCIKRGDYQCKDGMRHAGATAEYDELVLSDGAQLLPVYRIFFKPP